MTVRTWFRLLRAAEFTAPYPGERILYYMTPDMYHLFDGVRVTTWDDRRAFIDGTSRPARTEYRGRRFIHGITE